MKNKEAKTIAIIVFIAAIFYFLYTLNALRIEYTFFKNYPSSWESSFFLPITLPITIIILLGELFFIFIAKEAWGKKKWAFIVILIIASLISASIIFSLLTSAVFGTLVNYIKVISLPTIALYILSLFIMIYIIIHKKKLL